jgi:predicted DNA-binding antitoxin AbrB/MazE fold protein
MPRPARFNQLIDEWRLHLLRDAASVAIVVTDPLQQNLPLITIAHRGRPPNPYAWNRPLLQLTYAEPGGQNMINVPAVYENGVLRPTEPLELTEGQRVRVAVYPQSELPFLRPPTDVEEKVIQRMNDAKTLQELFAVYESLPSPDDGYDLCLALNANRKETGERLLYPELDTGAKP